jgi:hypothetical protein
MHGPLRACDASPRRATQKNIAAYHVLVIFLKRPIHRVNPACSRSCLGLVCSEPSLALLPSIASPLASLLVDFLKRRGFERCSTFRLCQASLERPLNSELVGGACKLSAGVYTQRLNTESSIENCLYV